ncbi:MAG: FtsX-like permease family protein [Candidatus Hodarchaeales archaeon]|jgi:ABC-type antimicrobial peptide transport system permease subunit
MWLPDFLGIVKDYFTENHRNILITALGLIFIISIFSVTLTSEQGMKHDYIKIKLESDIEISFVAREHGGGGTSFDQRRQSITSYIMNKAVANDVDDLIIDDEMATISSYVEILNFTTGQDWPEYIGSYDIAALDGSLEELLNSSSRISGRFPREAGEVLWIKGGDSDIYYESGFGEPEPFEIKLNQTINVSRVDYSQQREIFRNYTLQVVGIYDTQYIATYQWGYPDVRLNDELIADNPVLLPGAFYTADYDSYQSVVNTLNIESYELSVDCQFTMSLLNKIDPTNFEQRTAEIATFLRDVSWSSMNYYLRRYIKHYSGNGYWDSGFYSVQEFDILRNELASTFYLNLFLILPALSITIYFSSFTSNTFFDRRRNQIGLLRIRGISRKQLLGVLVLEGFLSAIASLVLGYLLGIVLALFTFRSTEFLDYQPALLGDLHLSIGTFNAVLIWTFIIAGMIITSRVMSLSRLDVIEARSPTEKKPFWRRLYLDLVLLALGIGGNMFFFFVLFNPTVMMQLGPLGIIIVLLALLFIPFPFFLLFGGIMTLSRIVSPVVSFIARMFWHRFANLFSYSLTTMVRQKESAIRAILLISITFAMIWATFTLPPVLITNNTRTNFYAVGADCYYQSDWNLTIEETIFAEDENIADFVPVGATNMYLRTQVDVFIIFPRFLEIAYFEDSFGSTTIEELFQDNHTIMMDNGGLKNSNKKVGDFVTFINSSMTGSIDVKVLGSFEYWPRLVTDRYGSIYGDYFYGTTKIVMANETFTEFYKEGVVNPQNTITEGYYFKLTPGANITALGETYGADLEIVSENLERDRSSLGFKLLWMQLNVLFLVNLITIVLAIILHGYRQARGRARELSVERSLGMKQVQIGRLFFYESLSLLWFSYIFGSILGFLFSTSIVSLLIMATGNYALPPPLIFYPLDTIHVVLGLLIVSGMIASMIPAIFARRQDITKSLKVN